MATCAPHPDPRVDPRQGEYLPSTIYCRLEPNVADDSRTAAYQSVIRPDYMTATEEEALVTTTTLVRLRSDLQEPHVVWDFIRISSAS